MRQVACIVLLALMFFTAGSGVLAQRQGGVLAQRQGGAGRLGGPGADGRFQGRGRGQQTQGTAVIRGRVINASSGTPLRRAQVRAVASDIRASRLATTDVDGQFELRGLPAGRWIVSASKGGFVTQQLGQRRPFEAVEPLELADGQRVNASFALSRGGAISGRIFDEFGDPITGAVLRVMRSQMAQGRRRLVPAGNASQTDDNGAFRLYGLAPGDYFVAASLRGALDVPDDAQTYVQTFYPGTANVTEAQRISISAGEEQSNINFVLLPLRAVRVSGTVVDSSGTPLQAMVNLTSANQSDDGELPIASSAASMPDGTFTIGNVVPGIYTLNVTTRFRGNTLPEIASLPLTVGNEDLTGISVVTTRGGSLRGSIVAEGGARLQTSNVQVVAQPLRPVGNGGLARAQVSASGTFELTGLVGPTTLRFDRLPAGWSVKSIAVGGADVTDAPLDFKGTEQLVARVLVTDKVTELSGTVRSRGDLVTTATVVIFSEDESKWRFPTRFVRTAHVDKGGAFAIRGLPPDENYLAVAVDYVEQGEAQDPEFLQRVKTGARSVTLRDAESRTLDLALTER